MASELSGFRIVLPAWWSERALNLARMAAVTAAAAVPFSTALTSAACAIMLLAWLASGQAFATLAIALRQPIGMALAVFFSILALGALHGPADWGVRLEALWGWRKLAYVLILLALFQEERWKRRFVIAFLAVACVGFVASYLSWLQWIPAKAGGHAPGVILRNHAFQGMIFALAVLCCYHLASLVSARMRLVLLLFGILFALNIVFISPGRSGYLALLAAVILIALAGFGWRRLPVFLVAAGVGMAVAFTVSPILQERVKLAVWEVENFNPAEGVTSIGFRLVAFENTVELIAQRPFAGHGTGSFAPTYSSHVAKKYTDWRGDAAFDPHNQYLFVLAENGLIGLAAFLGFCLAVFLTRGLPWSYRWIGVGALSMWMLTSLFSSHFRTFGEGHLIGLFLGAMFAGGSIVKTK